MKKLTLLLWCMLLCTPAVLVSCGDDESDDIVNSNGGSNSGSENTGGNSGSVNIPVNTVSVGDAKDVTFQTAVIPYTVNVEKGKRYDVQIRYWYDIDGKLPDFNDPGDVVIFGCNPEFAPGPGTGKPQTLEMKIGVNANHKYSYVAVLCREGEPDVFSEVKQFVAPEIPVETGKAVDLGLSIKWAGYNVGGEKPEDAGDFFAWGETKTKSSFTQANYTLSGKYSADDAVLAPEDDAATANWGTGFRMPTCAEKHELLTGTTRIYTEYHGVPGVVFVSKVNNKCIFFPYTGGKLYGSIQRANDLIGIWTSTAHANDDSAYIMCNIIANSGILEKAGFDMDGVSASFNLSSTRYYGYKVRAVSK